MRDTIKLHYQPLILKEPGQLPTVPQPPSLKPGDNGWDDNFNILIGQTAYNIADNRVYIRNGNEIMPYKHTMYYIHEQAQAADTWVITHKLNFKPSVTIVDDNENEVEAEVVHDSEYKVTVKFNKPFVGRAYFS
jgi:hypothetical protein